MTSFAEATEKTRFLEGGYYMQYDALQKPGFSTFFQWS